MRDRLYRYFKYVVSGGSAACVNIGTLYLLTEYAHWYYLLSAALAFVAAFAVSFTLQKFWTFKNSAVHRLHEQAVLYFAVALLNLVLNTLLLYLVTELFHIWYVLSEILVAAVLAVATYGIYRYVIFDASDKVHPAVRFLRREMFALVAIALAAFLTCYQLTESPPTWLDEGIITQVAMNIAHGQPKASLMVAPGQYVSAGYVSTSYPVTYPIAAMFEVFGTGLLQARIVMAFFLILCVFAVYWFTRTAMAWPASLYGLFLLVTFAPLYGDGKNVLGEVPGMLFLILFLYTVWHIEYRQTRWYDFLLAGLLLGLTVATKPIFILLLLPAGIVLLFSRSLLTTPKVAAGAVGFLLPTVVWLTTQFGGESVQEMLALYANPHNSDVATSAVSNLMSFFTKPEPLYAAGLLGVWIIACIVRVWRKERVSRAEWIAVGFSTLIYLAYLRGAPYYRYFFEGEVLALMYFAQSLRTIWRKKILFQAYHAVLAALIAFQLYQCFFSSWVAGSYQATRTHDLMALRDISPQAVVFVYQAPETVPFLPVSQYYQYLKITDAIVLGTDELPVIERRAPDIIVSPNEDDLATHFPGYEKQDVLDRYALWYKKTQ